MLHGMQFGRFDDETSYTCSGYSGGPCQGADWLSGWAAQDRGLDLSKPCIRVGPSAALTLASEGLPAEHGPPDEAVTIEPVT
jgi:hypothetical protein